MKIRNRLKHHNRRKAQLPEDNYSVARYVNEGNPDSQIKEAQKEAGESPDKPIPDGDRK